MKDSQRKAMFAKSKSRNQNMRNDNLNPYLQPQTHPTRTRPIAVVGDPEIGIHYFSDQAVRNIISSAINTKTKFRFDGSMLELQ